MTGACDDAQRVLHRVGRDVAQIDEHPEPVHLLDDLFAEGGQPVGLRRVGGGVGPRRVASNA